MLFSEKWNGWNWKRYNAVNKYTTPVQRNFQKNEFFMQALGTWNLKCPTTKQSIEAIVTGNLRVSKLNVLAAFDYPGIAVRVDLCGPTRSTFLSTSSGMPRLGTVHSWRKSFNSSIYFFIFSIFFREKRIHYSITKTSLNPNYFVLFGRLSFLLLRAQHPVGMMDGFIFYILLVVITGKNRFSACSHKDAHCYYRPTYRIVFRFIL